MPLINAPDRMRIRSCRVVPDTRRLRVAAKRRAGLLSKAAKRTPGCGAQG